MKLFTLKSSFLFLLVACALFCNQNVSKANIISNNTKMAMEEIAEIIDAKYYNNVDLSTLEDGALDGMLKTLDPYSGYFDKESLSNFQQNTTGTFAGIGMETVFDSNSNSAAVNYVYQNAPADRAGVAAGDTITHINDQIVVGKKLSEIAKLLRGQIGSSVKITFYRSSTRESFTRLMRYEELKIKNVFSKVYDNSIGLITINMFTQNTYQEVINAINVMMKKYDLKGLIFDLRNNPGGLLISAVDIANLFLKDGQLITTVKMKNNLRKPEYFVARNINDNFAGMKIAILINRGTASASEILAGCLQDYKIAKLIGETTFGKGLVQEVFKLKSVEGAVRLTTAQYFTPNDRQINGIGIEPDIAIQDKRSGKYDPILQAGINYISGRIG